MKNIILNKRQVNLLIETISNGKVICDKCGWTWDLSDGGNDPYICHECGHDNAEEEFIGKKVMVYYNLHKHTFSIQYKNKVIIHADYVKLGDVEFRVRQGGKEKVRSKKQKNVHAFAIGNLLDYCNHPCDDIPNPSSSDIVTYDPYKYNSFVYKETEEPIFSAEVIDMINLNNKIFIVKK